MIAATRRGVVSDGVHEITQPLYSDIARLRLAKPNDSSDGLLWLVCELGWFYV